MKKPELFWFLFLNYSFLKIDIITVSGNGFMICKNKIVKPFRVTLECYDRVIQIMKKGGERL